jgi:hypothetical protein
VSSVEFQSQHMRRVSASGMISHSSVAHRRRGVRFNLATTEVLRHGSKSFSPIAEQALSYASRG